MTAERLLKFDNETDAGSAIDILKDQVQLKDGQIFVSQGVIYDTDVGKLPVDMKCIAFPSRYDRLLPLLVDANISYTIEEQQ